MAKGPLIVKSVIAHSDILSIGVPEALVIIFLYSRIAFEGKPELNRD